MPQHKLATLWSRVGAGLIDAIIVVTLTGVACFGWSINEGMQGIVQSESIWNARGLLVALAVDLVYAVYFMSGSKQSTPGQRALNVRIAKVDGSDVGVGSALGRYLVSLISSILLKIGFLIAVFTARKQTLHDLAAGTIVVKVSEPTFVEGIQVGNSSGSSTPRSATEVFPSSASNGSTSTTRLSSDMGELASHDEEALYEQALSEISAGKRPGLWAMALAQTAQGGNTEGVYIALRVEQLKTERLNRPGFHGGPLG